MRDVVNFLAWPTYWVIVFLIGYQLWDDNKIVLFIHAWAAFGLWSWMTGLEIFSQEPREGGPPPYPDNGSNGGNGGNGS